MRDLYKRLGIYPNTSAYEIRFNLHRIKNSKFKNDIDLVLLDENNRKQYDRVHTVLSNIAELRAQLGLNYSDNWKGTVSTDFSKEAKKSESMYNNLISKLNSVTKKNSDPQRFKNVFLSIFARIIGLAIIIGIIFVSSFIANIFDTEKEDNYQRRKPAQDYSFDQPQKLLPYNGEIRRFTNKSDIAPFEINSDYGSNYFVKLEDSRTGKAVINIFVRGGETVKTEVPLGSYIMKYASGNIWYGYKYLFGKQTIYSKSDDIFRFEIVGNQVNGYTVTLYKVIDGNLRTYEISPEQF